jgi:hypothetical protein
LLELINRVAEMHDVFVEKIKCELRNVDEDGGKNLQVCDFSDGAHDDLGAYLYGYYNQISEV